MIRPSPSRRRAVTTCVCSLAFLTIVDRVSISAAKTEISAELGISDALFGWVFGAFTVGYTLLMMPSGWLADRVGPRKTLALCVLAWSVLTALTGWVYGTLALLAVRFLFGLTQAGAFPGAARAIANWLPVEERGLAMGLLNTGSRLGAAFGLWGVSVSVVRFGWRESFWGLAAAGVVWAAFWFWWFRDRPPGEILKTAAPSGAAEVNLLRMPSAYLLPFQYFASQVTFFLCFTWLLPYLWTRFRLSAGDAGFYAAIPLYVGAMANWVSGNVVDRLYRVWRGIWSRKLPAICGFALASAALPLAAAMEAPGGFILFFAIATFGVDLTLSPSWTACADIGGKHTGTLSGAMNMMGSVGGLVSSVLFPVLFTATGGIWVYFSLAIVLNLAGAVAWWLALREPKKL